MGNKITITVESMGKAEISYVDIQEAMGRTFPYMPVLVAPAEQAQPPAPQGVDAEPRYKIAWQSQITNFKDVGFQTFSKLEAQQIVNEWNIIYNGVTHYWIVPAEPSQEPGQ